MDEKSSIFFDTNDLVSLKELKANTTDELKSFYAGDASLNQFFFSAICNEVNDFESPFIIGYLSNILSDKFINFDFSLTGRKSMWQNVFEEKDLSLFENLKGLEYLSTKYQSRAELALFNSSFLKQYLSSKNTVLDDSFFINIGQTLYKNSALNTNFSDKKALMNHMSHFFEYYSKVLTDVANNYVWSDSVYNSIQNTYKT
jgi:hypothetical protein